MSMKIVNIRDKDGNAIKEGDEFWAYMIRPSFMPPTKVKVVVDTSPENIECGRDYDVESKKGDRSWNAYMVLSSGDRCVDGETASEYHRKKVVEWLDSHLSIRAT